MTDMMNMAWFSVDYIKKKKNLNKYFCRLRSCRYCWDRDGETVALMVIQNPERKRPWAADMDMNST